MWCGRALCLSVSVLFTLISSVTANAHYLWVVVDNYNPKVGDTVTFRVGLGHGDEFPKSDILTSSEPFIEVISPDGKTFTVEVKPNAETKEWVGKFVVEQQGTYVVSARLYVQRRQSSQTQGQRQQPQEGKDWGTITKPLEAKNGFQVYPVGVIRSPYGPEGKRPPHQGRYSHEICQIVIRDEFAEALKGIDHASHLIVLYWMDRARRDVLASRTPWSEEIFGVFATRSPSRPNPIGICIVELLERKGNTLFVKGLDAFDNTPVVDIKPFSFGIDAVVGGRMLFGAGRPVTGFDMVGLAFIDVGQPSPTVIRRPPTLTLLPLDSSARRAVGSILPILVMENGFPVTATVYATTPNMKPAGEDKEFAIKLPTTDLGLANLKLDRAGIWLVACQLKNSRTTLTFSVGEEK